MAKMKEFKVTGPDGRTIPVMAPEDATDDQIIAIAEKQFYAKPERPKVDLEATKAESLRILEHEYRNTVQEIIRARSAGDQAAVDSAEQDRVGIAREIQRLGGEIPGAPPTATTAKTPGGAPGAGAGKSMATKVREATAGIDPDRALTDLAAMAGGAGGSALMSRLSGALQGPAGGPAGPQSAVQKWSGKMGYGDRGGRTFAEAHQLEQGLRKGARIGGVQPEFRFAKPPIPEPSMMQRAGQMAMGAPKTVGALGGLSMAESGMEAMQRMQQGDPIGAAIAGAGAAGGALAAIPTPMTRVGGMALSAASPLTLYLYDKLRQKSPAAAEQLLQEPSMISVPQ